jgi:hypothetical protein
MPVHESKKLRPGPGGIKCPCCVKFHPTELKKRMSRDIRRKIKQLLSGAKTVRISDVPTDPGVSGTGYR